MTLAAAAIALVVAMDEDGIIGRGAALPWHLPDDLKHFKAVTLGKAVVMGRRTYDTIGRPLPGRRNLVLSRGELQRSGVQVVRSLEQACELAVAADPHGEICVIGGAQLYALALPHAQRIYLTRVHAHLDGDARFPVPLSALSPPHWRETGRREHGADERHAWPMSFVTLERGVTPQR